MLCQISYFRSAISLFRLVISKAGLQEFSGLIYFGVMVKNSEVIVHKLTLLR